MNTAPKTSAHLLFVAITILERAQRYVNYRSVASEVNEIWTVLHEIGARPTAIGTTSGKLRSLVVDGHIAEARTMFEVACTTAVTEEERNVMFNQISAHLSAAEKVPPPPIPSIVEDLAVEMPAGTDEEACMSMLAMDPFLRGLGSYPEIAYLVETEDGYMPVSKAHVVVEFDNDGEEPVEVQDSDIIPNLPQEIVIGYFNVEDFDTGPNPFAPPRLPRFFGSGKGIDSSELLTRLDASGEPAFEVVDSFDWNEMEPESAESVGNAPCDKQPTVDPLILSFSSFPPPRYMS